MAKVQPLLLDQDLEALQGPEVGVQEELRQGNQLGCSVPTVAAVDYHGSSLSLNNFNVYTFSSLCYCIYSLNLAILPLIEFSAREKETRLQS